MGLGRVEENGKYKQCHDSKMKMKPSVGLLRCIYWCVRNWEVIGLYMTPCRFETQTIFWERMTYLFEMIPPFAFPLADFTKNICN